ncbi:TonB-dependent receptor plug domain-containing protein [Brevundimonas sp.]|uniref:TonB-dependent receptor plug domain-containing protein n=1 Tax=Brevundimonas sp. TaxID=1871086 RepID=UPI003D09AFAA
MVRRDRFLCTAALSALMCMAAGAANAQVASPSSSTDEAQDAVDDIVVTGSRVVRTGFDAPTPTTVLSSEEMEQRGSAQIGEFLTEAPAFRATQTPQTNPQSARGAGQYFADLRALGSIRTLVLVDGRRFVPSSPEGQVDLNLIPSVMVSRVDVVTGGASAQWGSDAVAGVVNVILNNTLDGLKGDFSYGESTYGDNEEVRASVAGGTDFAGGRGHVVVGGEYVKGEGVLSHYDRPFGRDLQEQVSYSGARLADQPSRFFAHGVQPLIFTDGGVIIGANTGVGQPLRGIQFGPGGTVVPFTYGDVVGTSAINFSGGQQGLSVRSGHTLSLPVERSIALFHADFDVNDNLSLFAEASYANAGSDFHTAYARDSTAGALTIQRDNAYLPAAVRTIMLNNNIASFSLGRQHKDFGEVSASNFNTTTRFAFGASGAFGDGWTWDAYYQYGENEYRSTLNRLKINANLTLAVDAVVENGVIVCRNVAARAAGCQPINLFGEGSPSQQAINYVTGTATYNVDTSQEVMAANIQGTPFSTWAGPVSIAAGVERRVEEAESRVDAISQASGFSYGNPKNFVGSYEVNEAYAEVVAPLLTDAPFAQSIEFNGAYRFADYSTSGGISTWKAGLTWLVNDMLTFRATRSRDIRAPNNSDLFAQTSSQATLRNPFSGATTQMNVISGGNAALVPEEADTLTLGVVLSPSAIPGLRLSVDYFDIDIADAISSYAAQNVLDSCLAEINAGAAGFFCNFVTRTGTGAATVINSIGTPLLNIAGFEARGYDFEAGYRFDLFDGSFNARLFGTYTEDLIANDGLGVKPTFNSAGVIQTLGSVIDRAGQVGGFTSSSITGATSQPRLILNGSLTYSRDNWSVTLQERYIGGGLIDASLVGPDSPFYNAASPISIGDNTVDERIYTNVSANYQISDAVEIYGVINNVANTEPPFAYTSYAGFYDKIGRTYKVGMRLSF